MNDSFIGSNLPWSQSTKRPETIGILNATTYILWQLISKGGKYKLIPDLIVLIFSSLCLFFRIKQPLFNSRLVMQVSLIKEVGRLWTIVAKIAHTLF